MTRGRFWGVAATVVVVSILAGFVFRPLFSNRVYAGVCLEGVDLGGKSREEVVQLLNFWRYQERSRKIMLYYGDSQYGLDAAGIEADIDVNAAVDEVWNVGRRGSWWDRLKIIRSAASQGYRIPLRVQYNESKLDQLISEWEDTINRPPRNAALSIATGVLVPPEQGRKLEVEALRPLVLQALKRSDIDTIPLPVSPVYPEITLADISQTGIREQLSMYSTAFNADDANRTWNIKVATSRINGHIVYPGQAFSFNEVVGPRDKAHGYKEALEIVDGEFVPGIGGGVCQVSSTLYNTVLLADLRPVERYNHSKPLGYVALGRDATVAYGALDFKFENNTGAPVMIMTEIEGSRLYIGLFGTQKPKATVEIVTVDKRMLQPSIVQKRDENLYLGETKVDKQGKPGYEVTTVRIVRDASREVRREILSRDVYQPEDTVVKVGARIPPFASVPSTREKLKPDGG